MYKGRCTEYQHCPWHNKTILDPHSSSDFGCNCRSKENCPLDGKCQTENVIYQATVISESSEMNYIGSCSTSFKLRYNDHMCSLRNSKYKCKTELANYIWHLKDNDTNFEIKWRILDRARPYQNGNTSCNLCLTEKMFILKSDKSKTLNKRDLILKCRHKFKFKIKHSKICWNFTHSFLYICHIIDWYYDCIALVECWSCEFSSWIIVRLLSIYLMIRKMKHVL